MHFPRGSIFSWNWGLVPTDGDVVPFSQLNAGSGGAGRKLRKHHYLSITYMEGFTGPNGRVWAYFDNKPDDPQPSQPESIGYRKLYYSLPSKDGGRDDTFWEDHWNRVETVWPVTVAAARAKRLSPAISFNLLGMVAILMARVPAARERHEYLLAQKMRAEIQTLEAVGALPAHLAEYAGKLDRVPVGINPEQSLANMPEDIMGSGDLAFRMGFEVLHNKTGSPFLTTDNPVCFYNPSQSAHARIPYPESGEIELIFPIDAGMVLRGSTRLRPVNSVVRHRVLSDKAKVRKINRTVAQFGYRLYIARDRSCDDLVRHYAATVPTVHVDVEFEPGHLRMIWRHLFGQRPILSPYVDTPEKAARLTEVMERGGFFD